MREFITAPFDLHLFEGEGGAAAPASAGEAQGETQASSASTRRGKTGEYANVLFGKQAASAEGTVTGAQASDAGGQQDRGVEQTTSDTLEAKRKAYRDMVNSDEWKDIHTQETQRIIDRRFKETKELQGKVDSYQGLIDTLRQRYGTAEGDMTALQKALDDDTAFWAEAAENAGMSVDAYKQVRKLERENAQLMEREKRQQGEQRVQQQLQQWYSEAEGIKAKYPAFDLQAEVRNPQFLRMLQSGVPVEHAFKVVHMDEIMQDALQTAAQQTERRVVDNVRAKGTRPRENGTASQGGFTVKDDVSKLSKKDRAEIARRAMRGETISF